MAASLGTVTIALPIADRRSAMEFYQEALGLDPFGDPADDGVPEPLQFRLAPRTVLMLVPTDGFGWVLGGRGVAEPGASEVVLSVAVETEAAVAALVERVRAAGGAVVSEPERLPWGYSATWADLDGHLWQVLVEPSEG
ncbi:Glyoxalase/bleomycin resistance protein/dioxygenase [Beutenbergia cavernae DSM 12333]|uniref:Glyoxalase/bleomycin resistance protein/dioxygenase n=1 Tax=Beutenbergia cavernae (strain ATCC BAA-8 / DSM 12333 / CCUG 43141 / JCM 11478 / NBRC 16432 / NCIMB 13614 / HKI 0122) TaxID=471853 RepID=C5C4M0_BEUC1|nr:VOC family protein [Beutenbergia cavernae]ACQ82144.1 Glyoxalase/bleomycin resistance protein/dioxygenase [Beutenbergia cavernae DSM 12333]